MPTRSPSSRAPPGRGAAWRRSCELRVRRRARSASSRSSRPVRQDPHAHLAAATGAAYEWFMCTGTLSSPGPSLRSRRSRRLSEQLVVVGPVLERVAALTPDAVAGRGFLLVGIAGRGGSGKTTLARSIPGAQIVGTDEFWDGEGFELSRLRAEVVEPILRTEPAESTRIPGSSGGRWSSPRRRAAAGHRVEGVCALHAMFARSTTFESGWRLPARSGSRARSPGRRGGALAWENRWMPSEDRLRRAGRSDLGGAADRGRFLESTCARPETEGRVRDVRERRAVAIGSRRRSPWRR